MARSRFSKFLDTFDPQAHRRGQQWEEVCQWFLRTDHLYRTQLTKVWVWNEWPDRWGPDAGIDLVKPRPRKTLGWHLVGHTGQELRAVNVRDEA